MHVFLKKRVSTSATIDTNDTMVLIRSIYSHLSSNSKNTSSSKRRKHSQIQSLKALDQTWNVDDASESGAIGGRHRPNRSHTRAYEFQTVAVQSTIRVGFEKAATYLN